MLHRCAFDARSSVALSAHPWNLPYHSRAILSPSLFRTRNIPSLPSDFCLLLSQSGCGFSLSLPRKSRFPDRAAKITHNIIHFIFHAAFSSHDDDFFRKVEKKILGVPLSNGRKVFFGKERKLIFKKGEGRKKHENSGTAF